MKNLCSQEPNTVNKIQHASVLARLNDRSQWHIHFPNRPRLVLTQSTMVHYSNSCSQYLALHEHCWPGSSRTSRAGLNFSRWVYISRQSWSSRSAFRRGLCSGLSCLPSTAARWVTSSQTMVFTVITTPMTRSSILPWVPTTQLHDCLFLLCVPLTSDSGNSKTACSSTRTSRRL